MINGIAINSDYELTNPIFKEGIIRVNTNDLILPDDWNGYVEFMWEGETYRGYVKSIDIIFSREEVLEYELIEC